MSVITKAVFPVAGLGTRFPAGDQGESQGNAAGGRQAADPVCGRGGGRRRHHRAGVHHRPRQARDRGPFRHGVRGRVRARDARQARDARDGARCRAASRQMHLRAPAAGARSGARRAVRATGGRRSSVRGHPGRRPDRRQAAGDEADGRCLSPRALRAARRAESRARRDAAVRYRQARTPQRQADCG